MFKKRVAGIFVALALVLPLTVFAEISASTRLLTDASVVSKLISTDDGRNAFNDYADVHISHFEINRLVGRWGLMDARYLLVSYYCNVYSNVIWWPEGYECAGDLEIKFDYDAIYDEHAKKGGSLPSWYFERNSSNYEDIVNSISGRGASLFESLLDGKNELVLDGRSYKLDGFSALAINERNEAVADAIEILSKRRVEYVVVVAIFSFVLVVGVFLLMRLTPILILKTRWLSGYAQSRIEELIIKRKSAKIQSVIRDERIRELVRSTINSSSVEGKEILLAEFGKAIENGDRELADALQKLIKES